METKNVGIWIRVSTDFQVKDDAPEHHEQRARYYAQAKGWNIVEVYRLDGLSGKSVMEYSEAKRMLGDIRSGRITGLIFSKLARLARNTKELLEFSEIFRSLNADLISLSESIDTSTPAGRLFYTMIAAMAEWERAEIADRVAASVPIRAKMGKPLGGQASLGYRWDGKELVIDEKEAPVRKLIYELFLKHKRKKTVADELNKQGYRTRNGSKFTDTTIMRLLQDPMAKGVRRANYTRSLGEGRGWKEKPEEDWIILPCPAIVSEEVWDECNAFISAQHKKRNKPGPKAVHLLAGYVHCHCGKKMYVYHAAGNFACKACKNKIASADLDEIYHLQLKTFLLSDEELDAFTSQSESALLEKEQLLEAARGKLIKLRKDMQKLVDLRMADEMSKEGFQTHYKPMEEQAKQLEAHLPELEAEVDFLKIHYLSSDTVLQDAKDLYDRWQELPFEEKRSIVEIITEKITIGKAEIGISFLYAPAAPSFSGNEGKGQQNLVPAAFSITPTKNAVARPARFRNI